MYCICNGLPLCRNPATQIKAKLLFTIENTFKLTENQANLEENIQHYLEVTLIDIQKSLMTVLMKTAAMMN